MNQLLETLLKILAVVLAASGLGVSVFAAAIADKLKLADKKQVDPERTEGMDEEELAKYRKEATILDVKLKGVLLALPGAILILILYKLN